MNIIELDKEHAETFGAGIDWLKVNKHVRRLQNRLFRATDEGNFGRVKALQKLIINSYYVKLYAIKQITQENTGKTTPGIDGQVYLTNTERSKLLTELCSFSLKNYKPRPVKQVLIPKGNGRMRMLGIPTVLDRVIQSMVKLAMEPEWECKFHGNSFGFRPGRRCQDAIELIRKTIREGNGNYIMDADITGCFDNIQHKDVTSKIHFFRGIVEKWLNAGKIVHGNVVKTEKGTPQGGVISPLLANIALNDLDYRFNRPMEFRNRGHGITLIRYADDFVVLTRYEITMQRCFQEIKEYLEEKGLTLNTEKTKIVRKDEGFDFLGFHIVRYHGKSVWIQANHKSIKRFHRNVKAVFDQNKQVKTDILIIKLNRKILGWARYYQYSRIHIVFPRTSNILWRWTWRWCYRRHPRKGKRWITNRYFRKERLQNWTLYGEIFSLARVTDIKSVKYRWRVGNRTPFNPNDRKYWEMEDRIRTAEENLQCNMRRYVLFS